MIIFKEAHMATTKIIKVKVNPKATIKYITNPEKTDGKMLVSYEGCSEENAAVMFDLALQGKRKQRKDSVLAYHLIQSFSPDDDLTPEKAHEIGEQFMEQLFHGKYSFVCATHEDKKHLHNHFVICAAERGMTGKKINDDLALLHKIQRVNDKICRENGLSVIAQKRGRGKKHNEWQMEQENPGSSQKSRLQKLIDDVVAQASDFDDFIRLMKEQNVEISFGNSKKYGTVTKYKLPDGNRCHRGYKLGREYTDSAIKKRIENRLRNKAHSEETKTFQKEQNTTAKAFQKEQKAAARVYRQEQKRIAKASMTASEKAQDKASLKISHIVEISPDEAYGLTRWKHTQNTRLSQFIEQEILETYGLQYTEIAGRISSLKAEDNLLSAKLDKQRKSCNHLRNLIDACKVYSSMKRYKEHLARAKSPEQYAVSHADQLAAYHDAITTLELNKVPLDLAGPAYITELQKFLESYEAEAAKIEHRISQNRMEEKELSKAQRQLDAYHRMNDEI